MNISFSMKCFLALLSITIFFYSAIGNGYILLIFCLMLIFSRILTIFINGTIKSFAWIFFIIFALFSLFLTKNYDASLKFIFVIVSAFLIKEVLKNENNWQIYFSKFIYFFALINVIATILSIIVPDLILNIVSNLYDAKSYIVYLTLFNNGAYAGINAQTGTNAFFISVFIAFTVSKIIDGSGDFSKYIFLALAIVALILTQKRSFLVANACAIVVLFLWNGIIQKGKSKKTLSFLFLIILVCLLFRYLPFTQNLLEKWNILQDSGDISNGRFDLWKESIDIWKTSPLFGVGAGSLVKTYDLSTHNVYIQVLAEMGIFGAISYLALIIYIIKNSFKISTKTFKCGNLNIRDKSLIGISLYVQVIYIVYAFFGNPLYDLGFFLTFAVFVAILESYNENSYDTPKEKTYENRYINIS